MKSAIFQSLIALARVPDTDTEDWLEDAEQSVRFLRQTCETNDELFLYASGPHFYVQSVLVLCVALDSPDHIDLSGAHTMRTDTRYIQRAYGGREGHRIFLEPPLNFRAAHGPATAAVSFRTSSPTYALHSSMICPPRDGSAMKGLTPT